MSVILIGSQAVGKSTLVVELNNPSSPNSQVNVISHTYEQLSNRLYAKSTYLQEDGTESSYEEARSTSKLDSIKLTIQAKLPSGVRKTLTVKWVDTAGELMDNYYEGKISNLDPRWQELERYLQNAQAIVLILAPHKNRLDPHRCFNAIPPIKPEEDPRFLTYKGWIEQFEVWLDFLQRMSKTGQQVLICLNMADLFCDCQELERRSSQENYENDLRKTYFSEVSHLIDGYNLRTKGNSLQLFVTTKENRILLELPWRYLAKYLENDEND